MALAVVNQLGAALEDIFQRSLPPVVLRDDAGEARIIAQRSDLQGLVKLNAFDLVVTVALGSTLAPIPGSGGERAHPDRASGAVSRRYSAYATNDPG